MSRRSGGSFSGNRFAQIAERDRGYQKLLDSVKSLRPDIDKPYVEIGVIGQGADAPAGEGITVALVAEWAEFGIGQPERSWLRGWIEEEKAEIERRLSLETRAILEGKRTTRQALARVGVWAVGQIQRRISAGIAPPNADSTIERKGSATPLIDTGQLRSSISSRVVE